MNDKVRVAIRVDDASGVPIRDEVKLTGELTLRPGDTAEVDAGLYPVRLGLQMGILVKVTEETPLPAPAPRPRPRKKTAARAARRAADYLS